MIGLDISKRVFRVHVIDENGAVGVRRRLQPLLAMLCATTVALGFQCVEASDATPAPITWDLA